MKGQCSNVLPFSLQLIPRTRLKSPPVRLIFPRSNLTCSPVGLKSPPVRLKIPARV
jgi:hypothetical protein